MAKVSNRSGLTGLSMFLVLSNNAFYMINIYQASFSFILYCEFVIACVINNAFYMINIYQASSLHFLLFAFTEI